MSIRPRILHMECKQSNNRLQSSRKYKLYPKFWLFIWHKPLHNYTPTYASRNKKKCMI